MPVPIKQIIVAYLSVPEIQYTEKQAKKMSLGWKNAANGYSKIVTNRLSSFIRGLLTALSTSDILLNIIFKYYKFMEPCLYIIIMIKFIKYSQFAIYRNLPSLTTQLEHNFSRKKYYKQADTIQPIQKTIIDNEELKNLSEQEQTKQVLKTYLQVIPPHKIQQILNPKKIDLSDCIDICEQRRLTEQELESAYKKIKKNVHIMKIQDLGRFLQAIYNQKNFGDPEIDKQSHQKSLTIIKKMQNRIISIVKKKMYVLSLQQIINFIYKIVKLNKKDFQLMKEVQRMIIQEKIPIKYPMIRKILWSFTHLDVGSSVLYSHISKTIKIGQHQLHPLQLAQSAYMLSKVTENATGGYGIFLIAEKHIQASINRLSFQQLTKAASFMLTQNIGSNNFQLKLQQKLYKKFPNKISLGINDLVTLLKSTSSYYFKFKDNALLHMLKTATQRMAQFATLQQFQDIIWSWGRAGKGDRQMWETLQQILQRKHIKFLKPRQISFMYNAVASTQYSSDEIVLKIEQRFFQILENTEVKPHYIVKFLLGMQKRKSFNIEAFLKLSKILCDKIPILSSKQLLSFVRVINQSDLHYASKDGSKQKKQPQLIIEIQKSLRTNLQQSINKKIYLFRVSQLVEILYMWIKLDLKQIQPNNKRQLSFTSKLFALLETQIINIPKNVFIKAFLCFVIKDQYKPALQMIPILYQLMKYGPIGYFFSPFQIPLLAYCLLHLQINGQGKIKIQKQLIRQISELLQQIDPIILNQFVRNGYEEAIKLKSKYQSNVHHSKAQ